VSAHTHLCVQGLGGLIRRILQKVSCGCIATCFIMYVGLLVQNFTSSLSCELAIRETILHALSYLMLLYLLH
jgi:hypothetical protein